MSGSTALERILRHERLIVLACLAAIAVLAWLFTLAGAGTGMSPRAMTTWQFPPPVMPQANEGWAPGYWLTMLAMWWAMMVAMMTPSAAPTILLYARVVQHARRRGQGAAAVSAGVFLAGYLLAWLAFSLAAVLGQWGLERLGLVHAMTMWSLDRWLSGALLVAAGVYQLTPLKEVCLRACRSPAETLARGWRPGRWGAVRLGLRHGAYCVGCCWLLMALLFVGGIMNLLWIAGLALFVLLEKVAPHGRLVGQVAGAMLLAAGAYVLALA